MVTTFYPPHNFGGDGIYVRQLARALARRGHAVTVVYSADAYRISGGRALADAVDDEPDPRVEVRRLESPFGRLSPLLAHQSGAPLLAPPGLRAALAGEFDVVHFHNISLMGAPGVLRLSRAPVTLLSAHDHWLVCAAHIFWKDGERACDGRACLSCQLRSRRPPQLWRHGRALARGLSAVDLVLAPSRFTRRMLAEGGVSRPIAVHPLFAPEAFATLAGEDPAGGPPTFLFVGRVTRSKGIDRFARLMRERPNYRLEIVGDGDLALALAAELRDAPHVTFRGRVDQAAMPRLYRRATAAVLPSQAPETFGLATIEAFSQGTPVIVRAAGGAGEQVERHRAGFVYRTDAEALAAMDALAADPELRARLGARARAAFATCFTEERHLASYLDHVGALRASRAAGAA